MRKSDFKYSETEDDVRQKFTGYEKDEETGLDFAQARMYQNQHARFTAVDPLLASGKSGNPQTFNRYVYVMNNPLFYTDPTGENCDPCDDEYEGQVYTMTDKDGNTFYNDEKLNNNWNIFEGNVTTTNKSTGTTVEVWGAFHNGVYHGGWGVSDENPIGVDAEIKPTGIDIFLGGFSEATYNVPKDIGRGIGNAGINTYNLGNFLTTNHFNREPLFNYIEPYEYSRENSTFGKGFEYGVPLIPTVVAPVFAGGAATPSVVPTTYVQRTGNLQKLFRGVNDEHPGFKNAMQGIAKPRGGHSNPVLHNNYNTKSIFTSWTTDASVAEEFAESGGVVLMKYFPKSKLVTSPDKFREFEVLVKGTVKGAKVRRLP